MQNVWGGVKTSLLFRSLKRSYNLDGLFNYRVGIAITRSGLVSCFQTPKAAWTPLCCQIPKQMLRTNHIQEFCYSYD